MKCLVRSILATLLLLIAPLEGMAISKKQQAALDKCTKSYNIRNVQCGDSDNANTVDSCLKKSDAAYVKCKKKVNVAAPIQSSPGDANSGRPVLSTE